MRDYVLVYASGFVDLLDTEGNLLVLIGIMLAVLVLLIAIGKLLASFERVQSFVKYLKDKIMWSPVLMSLQQAFL